MIDPRAAADGLAGIFPDLDAGELYAELTDGRKFLWIKRTISPEQRQRVHDLGEPGLLFGPRETRLYPERRAWPRTCSAAPASGARGCDAAEVIGTAGVERVFDARLRDPARGRRAAAALDRPRGADGARGRAGAGHERDAAPRARSAS